MPPAPHPSTRPLGPLAALAVALVALPGVGVGVLAATRADWLPWFAAVDARAVALFVVASVALCGLSLVPSWAVAVVAGWLFGGVGGSAVALAAIVGAAWFGRAILTPVVGGRWMDFVVARPRVHAVHAALLGGEVRAAATVVSLLRLAPVTPFAGTNLLMAAAQVATVPYLVGTLVGLGPRTALVAVTGAGLADLELERGGGASALWLAAAGLLVAAVGLWLVARRELRNVAPASSRLDGAAVVAPRE